MNTDMFKKYEKGFTLLELVIAMAIGVIIIGAMGGALYQILAASNSSSNNLMAIRQVQNAGYWISRDVQQSSAEYITEGDNPDTPDIEEIFTVVWDVITFDAGLLKEGHKAVYRLDGGNLYRDYYITGAMSYEIQVDDYVFSYEKTTLIAQYIDDIEFVKGSTMVLNVSATVEGWKPGTASRTYEIETRVN